MTFRVAPPARRRPPVPVSVIIGAGPRSLALVDDDGQLRQAHGPARCRALLEGLPAGGMVYSLSKLTLVLLSTGAEQWQGFTWKGALVRVKLDGGPTVYPVRRALVGVDPHEAVAGLRRALDWLDTYGVWPGSLGAMGWNLWRSTLTRPVRLGGPPEPARAALFGGRQEAPYPGDYVDARYHDLSAAYPASMAAERYPSKLVQIGPQTALHGLVGLARATVRVPALPWCPLPVRVGRGAVCYGYGAASGWWSARELVMARDAGCDVDVHELWAGVPELDLFGPWWAVVQLGRQLPGAAANVVKGITSSLWGQFAIDDDGGALVRWRDPWARRPVRVALVRGRPLPQQQAAYVATDTTARVRVRLWNEALAVVPDVLYCDTDAVVTGFDLGPEPAGWEPGRWRVKATMVRCEIRGPQVMRHTCPTCDRDHARWHYTVAGAPTAEVAERVFTRSSRTRGQFIASIAPGDITLPRGDLSRYQQTEVA